jgi:hypothetical protein
MDDISHVINHDYLAAADEIGERFSEAVPFPYIIMDNFFTANYAASLLKAFPSFDEGYNIGDDGKQGNKSTHSRIRSLGTPYTQLDDLIKSAPFLKWLSCVTKIPDLLYDPFYLGGGTHNNRKGMSLNAHVDFNFHPSERWHRRLNMLVYLNQEWQSQWGGSLALYKDPQVSGVADVKITPIFNRCVIFATTEKSWHGFDLIAPPDTHADITRKSIALYFYTRERPAVETASRHTTIYVQRPLPEYIRSGHVLGEQDVSELRTLLAERDAHIRLQYEENTNLLKAQDRGLAGQLIYLAKRFVVRIRR